MRERVVVVVVGLKTKSAAAVSAALLPLQCFAGGVACENVR